MAVRRVLMVRTLFFVWLSEPNSVYVAYRPADRRRRLLAHNQRRMVCLYHLGLAEGIQKLGNVVATQNKMETHIRPVFSLGALANDLAHGPFLFVDKSGNAKLFI